MFHQYRFLAIAGLSALVLSACTSSMMDSNPLSPAHGGQFACASTAGVYRLPKKLVKISVESAGARGFQSKLDSTADQFVPDMRPDMAFCLEHISSVLADDKIAVKRARDGLLSQISTTAEDKTGDILVKTIDIVRGIAVSRNTSLPATKEESYARHFDPADAVDIAMRNRELRRFGICIYVEGVNFDPGKVAPQAWCDNPARQSQVMGPVSWVLSVPVNQSGEGIYYRPNMTHDLVIMRKLDPYGPNPWTLHLMKPIEMPNLSPVYSVRIDRSIFATRNTRIDFKDGMLQDVRLSKTSEALELSRVLFVAAQAIVALPSDIVKFRTSDVAGQAQVLNAEALRDVAMLNYAKQVAELVKLQQPTEPPPLPSSPSPSGTESESNRSAQRSAVPDLARNTGFQNTFRNNCNDTGNQTVCDSVWRRYFRP